MRHLPPVGGDHVRRGRQAGGASELRHDLAAGVAVLRPAGILGIGEHMALAAAECDRFAQRPGAIRVERHPRLGNERLIAATACISSSPRITPPFSLKSRKP